MAKNKPDPLDMAAQAQIGYKRAITEKKYSMVDLWGVMGFIALAAVTMGLISPWISYAFGAVMVFAYLLMGRE